MDWPLLREMPEVERRRVLSVAVRRRFAKREVIFHQGDPGESMHFIAKGRIAIRITTPMGDVVTLRVLGTGSVLGELALVDCNGRRAASAMALENSETLALHATHFEALRRQHPGVECLLTAALAEEVRRLDARLVEALYWSADVRVVRRLVELADVYGQGEDADEAVIPLTQEELASMAGTSRATVNRVLGTAEKAGAVELRRGRIHIVDRAPLDRRAR